MIGTTTPKNSSTIPWRFLWVDVSLKNLSSNMSQPELVTILERATDLARKMVCEWGMSEKLGPLTFGQKEDSVFLRARLCYETRC